MEKILIVDDIEENIYLLRLLLQSKNYQVVSAADGLEALSLAEQELPDLIISDILMPHMDGFTLCSALQKREKCKNIPFIFYTATYTDSKDEEYALSLGAQKFIRKPVEPEIFIEEVSGVLADIQRRSKPPVNDVEFDEKENYKMYSQRLVHKLEKKMLDLETEIEKREEVERELRKSCSEWEEIFQAIGGPAILLDTDFNILKANRSAVSKMKGVEADLIGRKCHELFHGTISPPKSCPLYGGGQSEEVGAIEAEVKVFGGTYHVNLVPLRNELGDIEKYIHVAFDISKRLHAEKQLRKSEENFRQLFENIDEVFWIRDIISQKIIYLSPNFEKIWGVSPDTITQSSLQLLHMVHEEDKMKVVSFLENHGMEESVEMEFRIVRPDGKVRWINSKSFPVADADGKIVRQAGVYRDRTEKRLLDQEVSQAKKMEAIGTLTGGIAHDFNNILSSILGYSELVLEEVGSHQRLEKDILEIYSAGLRARELVKQLLAFARQSSEKKTLIEPADCIREVLKMMHLRAPANITITTSLASRAKILANSSQFQKVVENLCTNSFLAMEDNGGVLEINLRDVLVDYSDYWRALRIKPGKYVEMSVIDTGVGIEPELIHTIFEPYFTTREVGEGTGLGLAVVRGVVESCGGKIFVLSTPGEQTTFRIYLPIPVEGRGGVEVKEEDLPQGEEHILLADNEPSITQMAERILQGLGYRVTSTVNNADLINNLSNTPKGFDLVITDMAIQDISGEKLILEVKKIREDIPIILCTGFSRKGDSDSAIQLGVNAFIHKPFTKAGLARTVRMAIDNVLL